MVLGEVGTGKSTLCRCPLRSLNEQSGIDVFLLLDAGFEDADEFVRHLCELFAGQRPPEAWRAGSASASFKIGFSIRRWSRTGILSFL